MEDPNSKDEREFRVVSVVDPLTAERLSEEEACKRGWLKGGWEGGEWVDGARVGGKWVGDGVFRLTGDHSLSIHEAVDEGWIKVGEGWVMGGRDGWGGREGLVVGGRVD